MTDNYGGFFPPQSGSVNLLTQTKLFVYSRIRRRDRIMSAEQHIQKPVKAKLIVLMLQVNIG